MKQHFQLLTPLLLAVVPVLFFYATNEIDDQPWHVLLVPLAVSALFAIAVFVIGYALNRDVRKSAFIASAAIISLFISPVILVIATLVGGPHVSPLAVQTLAVATPCSFFFCMVWIAVRKSAEQFLPQLFSVAVFLLLVQLGVIGSFLVHAYSVHIPQTTIGHYHPITGRGPDSGASPSIYFIVLDGYANPETYATKFGYDNSAFLKQLEVRGFTIVRNSFSNYPMTELSLATSLNMTYMDNVERVVGRNSESLAPVYNIIQHSRVAKLCHELGYEFVNVAGRFGPTDWMPGAKNVASGWMDMFAYEYAEYTAVGFFDRFFQLDGLARYYNRTQRKQFELLAKSSATASPQFVFCHILSPHPPFLLDAGGKLELSPGSFAWPGDGKESGTHYVNQSKYVETQTLAAIDEILRNSPQRPIIIIQSDHGPGFAAAPGLEKSDEYLRHRQLIFNAMLLPDNMRARLPEQFSPVNNFRFVFNFVGNCNLPPLPNRAFFCTYAKPYDQTETTSLFGAARKEPAANPGSDPWIELHNTL